MIQDLSYLDKRKAEKLIQNLKNPAHKCAILLMMDAGLRVTECVSLKLSGFDFRAKTITIRSLKKRDEEVFRKVPISERLYEALANYVKTIDTKNPEAFLFPKAKNATEHISRKAINQLCWRIKKKDPDFKHLHPHALRHTCATQLINSGAQLHEVRDILGHKKYDTTLIYAHIPQEILKQRIDKATEIKLSFWAKLLSFIFPAKTATLINLTNEASKFIIGRSTEIVKATELANKNCNVIFMGPIGVGKTHLLNHLQTTKKILRFDDFGDLKKTLISALMYLYKNDKETIFTMLYGDFDLNKLDQHLQKDSVQNLCKELIKATAKHEYLLMIDNCDKITPKGIKTLEMLKDHFTIITTARQISVEKSSFLWNFEIIKIEPLPRQHALELIHKLAYDIDIEDMELFRNHIWEQSAGNPRVVFELVERYRKEILITPEVIRSVRHYGSMKEFDMSLFVMLGLASLAILRYASSEVGNDSLKFIGGCAMILLIFSRYLFSFTKRKFL
jgi:GTP-binding protein EngB required for normal cell division